MSSSTGSQSPERPCLPSTRTGTPGATASSATLTPSQATSRRQSDFSDLWFIFLLGFGPWLAVMLLALVGAAESIRVFVVQCTWAAIPILVICAGLVGLKRGRDGHTT